MKVNIVDNPQRSKADIFSRYNLDKLVGNMFQAKYNLLESTVYTKPPICLGNHVFVNGEPANISIKSQDCFMFLDYFPPAYGIMYPSENGALANRSLMMGT